MKEKTYSKQSLRQQSLEVMQGKVKNLICIIIDKNIFQDFHMASNR